MCVCVCVCVVSHIALTLPHIVLPSRLDLSLLGFTPLCLIDCRCEDKMLDRVATEDTQGMVYPEDYTLMEFNYNLTH